MTKSGYLNEVSKCAINNDRVESIEKVYGVNFPDIIKRIISYSEEAIFLDEECRILSPNEIRNAESDLHISFSEKSLIPVADKYENNFVVYHSDSGKWSLFNINDESVFMIRDNLENLI